MFSDVERSPSWHSPPLAADFGPQATYASSSSTPSSARPPVQPGWFPLQDASTPSTADPSRATNDMYNDHTMLPPPAHRPQPQPWPGSPPGPYPDSRPRGPYPGLDLANTAPPTTPSGYSPLYGYSGTPVHSDGNGFGWQDARPMASPSMQSTGLEHLRVPYDDLHRVHTAAQGMHVMMGGSVHPMGYGRYGSGKKHKEISVGRWTSEEHRVFLKGLELYQGPSWGEIARMIGTRTSTQVRTHAQKFFTKLARTNQVLPYFENQITKERARLVSQGAVPPTSAAMTPISATDAVHLSVTPTSTSTHSFAFNTLSPPRKYPPSTGVHTMQRPVPHSGYDGQAYPRAPMQQTSMGNPSMVGNGAYSMGMVDPAMDGYKPRLDSPPSDFTMPRKPTRLSSLEYAAVANGEHFQPSTPYGDHPMMPYTPTADAYRDPYAAAPPPQMHGDWSDAATRPWPQTVDVSSDPTHPGDPDSLPSVTKLLYRGGGPP